jgi:hypothetical protein
LKIIKDFISYFLPDYKEFELSETCSYPYLHSFGGPIISVEDEEDEDYVDDN